MSASRRNDKRRPAGVSRRRKRQLGFESLEDRRVMSAQSPVAPLVSIPNSTPFWQSQSYSSTTLQGQMAILQQEILNQAGLQSQSLNVTNSIPTDPLLPYQWHLINSGQQVGNPDFQSIFGTAGEDLNVAPVWNMGYTGQGVKVAVIDSGVQLNHPDLAANISPTLRLDPLGLDSDPSPEADFFDPNLQQFRVFVNAHGTAVAGLIGAVANNGIGGAGVAPGVQLVPIRLIDAGQTEQAFVNAFQYATLNGVDITNNSWGPAVVRGLAGPTANEMLALRDSIFFGRDGLGVIHVFASGNDGNLLDSSGYNGWVNSRYTIGVTGVDHDGFYNNIDGTVTGYPEISAAVLVAAPTGSVALDIINDTGIGSGIVTTDTTDGAAASGFNVGANPANGQEYDRDFFDDPSYTSRFNGTSAAAPLVSGVIALMLEANPNLSWRDVQEIFVRSARQNAIYGEAANGADKAYAQSFANTWINNQLPMFHDPDPWDPTIAPTLQTYMPTLDPNLTWATSPGGGFILPGSQNHFAASPAQMTNGAGYTVSMGFGTNNEWIGYGHGVIDAELAVQMAEQWSVKNQSLADEITFTTEINTFNGGFIPAGQNTGENRGDFVVPGGLGGETGFIDYYREYFDDMPFLPNELNGLLDNERSDGYVELTVPDDGNTMAVESVDVTLTFDNWAAAMDHLRVTLVSPTGSRSELNQFYVAPGFADDFVQIDAVAGLANAVSPNNITPLIYTEPGSLGGAATFTLSTKRHWGERSDNAVMYDPFTGDPVVDSLVGFDAVWNPGPNPVLGDLLQQGWQLHFENWGDTNLNLSQIEVAWHGRPIAANSERVMGFVGVDDNRDDLFNYSRVIEDTANEAAFRALDPTTLRLGDVINSVDPNQETFAANVTVTARRTSDNSIVGQFVTGHDGNFYFDLVPDDYTLSVDDPLGRTAIDDTLTPGQQLNHYRHEWHITPDYFTAWDHDPFAPTEVIADASGNPVPFLDALGNTTVTGMKGINFLLDPGAVAPAQVQFTGSVYADIAGNGAYDGDDVYMPTVTVFADVNRDGALNAGEITTQTDAQGNYTLVVPLTQAAVMNVGVKTPTNWTATKLVTAADPSANLFTRFARAGDTFDLPDFAIKPPANNVGGGGASQAGFLLGVVYNDKAGAGQGSRQTGEDGAANMTVFLDANNNGTLEATEAKTVTNEHGAYAFAGVTPGQKVVRIIVASPIVQTAPNPGLARVVTLTGSSTISNIQFGVRNTALYDYGDLPLEYGATLESQNGAKHKVGGYYLGAPGSNDVDAELDGKPTVDANGDDLAAPGMDEDGITFGTLSPGATVQLTVQASQSGYLQGWIDWNDDHDFNDVGERVLTDKGLVQGANTVTITVPAGANKAQVYSRFRFGAFGINSINGSATFGEVEDYRLDVAIPVVAPLVGMPADSNGDGYVNGNDFLTWQRNLGRTSGATKAQGDANGDHAVNAADLAILRGDFGDSSHVAAAVTVADTGDFDGDGDVDGNDFLSLQRGVGLAHPSEGAGDANHDGVVNGVDLAIWAQQHGQQSDATSSVAFASAAASTAVTASVHASASSSRSASSAASIADAALTESVADDAAAAPNAARASLNGRPFISLAGDAFAGSKAIQHASRAVREVAQATIANLGAARELLADADFRRDRAFDDLLGSRRRQGLRAEAAAEGDGVEVDCDAAFAALAEHFDWMAE